MTGITRGGAVGPSLLRAAPSRQDTRTRQLDGAPSEGLRGRRPADRERARRTTTTADPPPPPRAHLPDWPGDPGMGPATQPDSFLRPMSNSPSPQKNPFYTIPSSRPQRSANSFGQTFRASSNFSWPSQQPPRETLSTASEEGQKTSKRARLLLIRPKRGKGSGFHLKRPVCVTCFFASPHTR